MAKKKRIDQMVNDIIERKLEEELHRRLRRERKNVVRQRKATQAQAREMGPHHKMITHDDVVEAEVVDES